VTEVYTHHEVTKERQRSMLAEAAGQRQALRARALARATRRAERAQRQLAQSRLRAGRLRSELAAERGS